MTTNLKQFIAAGFERAHYAVLDSAGVAIGTSTSLANGSDSGVGKLEEIQTANIQIPEPQIVNVPGDDGVAGIFLFAPNEFPRFSIEAGAFDLTFDALVQSSTVYTVNDWELGAFQIDDPDYRQMMLLFSARAKSNASGSIGNPGWFNLLIPKAHIVPLGPGGLRTGANALTNRYGVIAVRTDTYPWGEAFTNANQGTTGAVMIPFWTENRVALHTHMGDGADTTFTLTYTPAAADGDKVVLWTTGPRRPTPPTTPSTRVRKWSPTPRRPPRPRRTSSCTSIRSSAMKN